MSTHNKNKTAHCRTCKQSFWSDWIESCGVSCNNYRLCDLCNTQLGCLLVQIEMALEKIVEPNKYLIEEDLILYQRVNKYYRMKPFEKAAIVNPFLGRTDIFMKMTQIHDKISKNRLS